MSALTWVRNVWLQNNDMQTADKSFNFIFVSRQKPSFAPKGQGRFAETNYKGSSTGIVQPLIQDRFQAGSEALLQALKESEP